MTNPTDADLGNVTIIPAAPGWHVLYPGTKDNRVVEFFRQPVLAWRVEVYRGLHDELCDITEPVTVDPCASTDIIQQPDGLIVIREERDFTDEAEALAYLNARAMKDGAA